MHWLNGLSMMAASVTLAAGAVAEQPAPRAPLPPPARAPSIELSIEMARAAVQKCSAFPIAVAVLDASSLPKLVYVPDGVSGARGEFAVRKARAALRYKMLTSRLTARAAADPALAAEIAADPGLLGRPGGVPIVVSGEIIGAIGVGGAPVSEDDEACAVYAVDQVRERLR